MVRSLLIAIAVFMFPHNSPAQFIPNRLDEGNQNSPPAHMHAADAKETLAGTIDGAKHPELIPDSTAFRLFAEAIAEGPNATEEQRTREIAFLAPVLGDGSDLQAVIGTLMTFKVRYTNLIDQYNQSVEKANVNGEEPDLRGFLQQRDALVQATLDTLKGALTRDGMGRLLAHIRSEKRSMKVSKEVK